MTQSLRKACLGGVVTAALLATAATASAQTVFKLTAGSSHPPVVPWVGVMKNWVVPQSVIRLKAMGGKYTIKWTQAYAGALYNFKNTLEGVQEGLADMGWVGTLWEPDKLPLQDMTYFLPFVTENTRHLIEIQDEMTRTIPAMNQQWHKYKNEYLGPQATDAYVIASRVPIRTLADLKGKKFYAPGAVARWLEGTGAIGVNGGLPVYYNGIKTGIADGTIVPGTGILPFKLHEVAPYIIKVRLGAMISGALTMNLDTWKRLPPEMKKMFKQLGQEYGDRVTIAIDANVEKHFKILAAKGAKISTMPLAEQKKWAKALPNIAADWVKATEKRGLPARQVLKAFMAGVRKRGDKPLRDWDKEI
jgi:TRAP-type C4-dicarboxylate transport system substrate-binding protein